MSRNLSLSINTSIAVLSFIYFFINDSDETVILPISSFLIFVSLLANFYITWLKIKDGTFLKVGKKQGNSVWPLLFGIIWILLGTFGSHSVLHWHGIDSKVFLGVLFISTSILRIENYVILVKEKNIAFNEFMTHSEWSISKISKVVVSNNNVSFFKNTNKKEFVIDGDDMSRLKQLLTEKFNDRLVIE